MHVVYEQRITANGTETIFDVDTGRIPRDYIDDGVPKVGTGALVGTFNISFGTVVSMVLFCAKLELVGRYAKE